MAQDARDIKSTYPLPSYNYRVTLLDGGEVTGLSFAEVSGLSLEYEAVTYKHGLSFAIGNHVIPGMRQPLRLSMQRGVAQNRDDLVNSAARVFAMVAKGAVKVEVMQRYALDEVVRAHEDLEAGKTTGSSILIP